VMRDLAQEASRHAPSRFVLRSLPMRPSALSGFAEASGRCPPRPPASLVACSQAVVFRNPNLRLLPGPLRPRDIRARCEVWVVGGGWWGGGGGGEVWGGRGGGGVGCGGGGGGRGRGRQVVSFPRRTRVKNRNRWPLSMTFGNNRNRRRPAAPRRIRTMVSLRDSGQGDLARRRRGPSPGNRHGCFAFSGSISSSGKLPVLFHFEGLHDRFPCNGARPRPGRRRRGGSLSARPPVRELWKDVPELAGTKSVPAGRAKLNRENVSWSAEDIALDPDVRCSACPCRPTNVTLFFFPV